MSAQKQSSQERASRSVTTSSEPAKSEFAGSWTQVVASFLMFFSTWGLLLSFGSFEQFYDQRLLERSSASTNAWISTLSTFLLLICGVLTGPAYDVGYLRVLIVSGSLVTVFALMMLSLSTELYQVFLTHGVLFGLGCGLLYVPSLAMVIQAFQRRRAIAVGLGMSGASIGGVIFPVIFLRLTPRIGFAWTVRVIAFILLPLLCISTGIVCKEQPRAAQGTRSLVDRAALKDVPFGLFAAGGFFVLMAYYVPFLFIPSFARSLAIGPELQLYLLTITNAASFFGRVLPSMIADKLGSLNTLIVAQACASVILFCWIAVSSIPGLVVWSIAWGFISGLLIVLPGAAVPVFCPSLAVIGTRTGMAWTLAAAGFLIGSPIAGAIIQPDSFVPLQAFSGASMGVGACLCLLSRLTLARRNRAARL